MTKVNSLRFAIKVLDRLLFKPAFCKVLHDALLDCLSTHATRVAIYPSEGAFPAQLPCSLCSAQNHLPPHLDRTRTSTSRPPRGDVTLAILCSTADGGSNYRTGLVVGHGRLCSRRARVLSVKSSSNCTAVMPAGLKRCRHRRRRCQTACGRRHPLIR